MHASGCAVWVATHVGRLVARIGAVENLALGILRELLRRSTLIVACDVRRWVRVFTPCAALDDSILKATPMRHHTFTSLVLREEIAARLIRARAAGRAVQQGEGDQHRQSECHFSRLQTCGQPARGCMRRCACDPAGPPMCAGGMHSACRVRVRVQTFNS